MGFADEDGASARTIARRRESDREFLAKVRELRDAGDTDGLSKLFGPKMPEWRVVVVQRALIHIMQRT